MVDLLKWQQTTSHSVFHSQSPTLRLRLFWWEKHWLEDLNPLIRRHFEPYQDQASQEGRLIAEVLVSSPIWVELLYMWPQIVPIPYISVDTNYGVKTWCLIGSGSWMDSEDD